MSSVCQRCFLVLGRNTKRTSRNASDSGLVWTMLTDGKSPKSTYLPATIWLTVFAGIGEKPGPTTNGCWSSSPDGRLVTKELSLSGTGTEAPAVIEVLKISECGVVKVATKDGTVKLGVLPVAPERHLQKLKRSLFAETSWAMGQECPQKLLVAPC